MGSHTIRVRLGGWEVRIAGLFSTPKERKEGHRIALHGEDLWLGYLLRHYAGVPQPQVVIGPQDPALFMYTGGTTGTLKAAVGIHHDLLMTGIQLKTWFGQLFVD